MRTEPPSVPVTPAEVETFWRDGVVCLRRVVASEWIDVLAAGMEANFADPGPHACAYSGDGADGGFRDDYCNWDRIDEYRRFLFDSDAAAVIATILRSQTVRLFHEHVLDKAPGTIEPTPWHHDQPYYPVDGDQLASTWIPLDPVSGPSAVRFVAGSHLGPLYLPRYFADHSDYPYDDQFGPVPDIEAQPDRYRVVTWDVEPGDCLVFHMRTLHAAGGNMSMVSRRRAFSARWLGDDAVYTPRPGPTSPPFPGLEDRLAPGGPMDDPLFPVVWPVRG